MEAHSLGLATAWTSSRAPSLGRRNEEINRIDAQRVRDLDERFDCHVPRARLNPLKIPQIAPQPVGELLLGSLAAELANPSAEARENSRGLDRHPRDVQGRPVRKVGIFVPSYRSATPRRSELGRRLSHRCQGSAHPISLDYAQLANATRRREDRARLCALTARRARTSVSLMGQYLTCVEVNENGDPCLLVYDVADGGKPELALAAAFSRTIAGITAFQAALEAFSSSTNEGPPSGIGNDTRLVQLRGQGPVKPGRLLAVDQPRRVDVKSHR